MTKIIIAGGRNFDDYKYLVDSVQGVLGTYCASNGCDLDFASGGARGADALGEKYCADYDWPKPKRFKPDYNKYHPSLAPLIRNQQMAEYAAGGILIAFLGEDVVYKESPSHPNWLAVGGTTNMIMQAISNQMDVRIFRYNA